MSQLPSPDAPRKLAQPYEVKPEDLYGKTADESEKARLRIAVVEAYGGHVAKIVSGLVTDRKHHQDAQQAGIEGLLIALERYEPPSVNTGGAFWAFANFRVRYAIQSYLDVGVYWRKDGKGNQSLPNRARAREEIRRTRQFAFLPDRTQGLLEDANPNPEEAVAAAEELALLTELVAEAPEAVIESLLKGRPVPSPYRTVVLQMRQRFQKGGE